MNSNNKLLVAKATFMCLASVLRAAREAEITGTIEVAWDSRDTRLEAWVKQESLGEKILQSSSGKLLLKDGLIVGAKLGEAERADLGESLNLLLQICYGIGCGVLSSTTLNLTEIAIDKTDAVGKFSDLDLMFRLSEIEREVNQQAAV